MSDLVEGFQRLQQTYTRTMTSGEVDFDVVGDANRLVVASSLPNRNWKGFMILFARTNYIEEVFSQDFNKKAGETD